MRSLLHTAAILLLVPAIAAGQGRETGVVANGQIYLPNGRPVTREIRFQLHSENFRRPPTYYYTDARGRFQITVETNVFYIITVETDDENWATTQTRFFPSGQNPRVDIFLEPFRREVPASKDAAVSLSALKQNVPAGARKEFEAGVKSMKKGEHEKAGRQLQRAIELFPEFVDAHNELAAVWMKENRVAEAEQLLRRAVEIDPDAVRPLLNLALCLLRQERYADAEPFLERATRLEPRQATAHMLFGIALFNVWKENDAERILTHAYELGGSQVAQAQYYLAKIYLRRNDSARAAKALERYLEDVPNDPNAAQLRQMLERLRSQPQNPN